jgi:hypothetical protein
MATRDVTAGRPRDVGRGLTGGLGRAGRRLSTETKHALKTTEFWVMVAVLIALLIAGNSIEGEEGGTDVFPADEVWLYVTILASAYMVSRGLAKAGSREPYSENGANDERAARDEASGRR